MLKAALQSAVSTMLAMKGLLVSSSFLGTSAAVLTSHIGINRKNLQMGFVFYHLSKLIEAPRVNGSVKSFTLTLRFSNSATAMSALLSFTLYYYHPEVLDPRCHGMLHRLHRQAVRHSQDDLATAVHLLHVVEPATFPVSAGLAGAHRAADHVLALGGGPWLTTLR